MLETQLYGSIIQQLYQGTDFGEFVSRRLVLLKLTNICTTNICPQVGETAFSRGAVGLASIEVQGFENGVSSLLVAASLGEQGALLEARCVHTHTH